MTQLGLSLSERSSRLLKKRGVSSAQSVPVEPGHPEFASYRLRMLMEQVELSLNTEHGGTS
jgi:hypothetical protein